MGASICNGASPIDPADMQEIEEVVSESVINILKDYQAERKRIVDQMRRSAPAPYENLSYSDYPKKNEAQVNTLAYQKAISEEVKKQIVDQVNQQIQPRIDAKTPNASSIERSVIHKALHTTIEQVVDKVIDKAIEKINENNKQDKAKV